MKIIENMKQNRLATIMAALALFIVIGGSATAASGLINGKKIKKGTITAKQIKNKTLTSNKFAQSTLDALKGAKGERGERGERGPQGQPGEKGETGPPGQTGPEVINAFSGSNDVINQPANQDVTVVNFNGLPSDKYVVTAKAVMFANNASALLSCSIETNNNGGGDNALWNSPSGLSRNTVPLVLATTAKVTQIRIVCNPGNTAGAFDVSAVAIPVG